MFFARKTVESITRALDNAIQANGLKNPELQAICRKTGRVLYFTNSSRSMAEWAINAYKRGLKFDIVAA